MIIGAFVCLSVTIPIYLCKRHHALLKEKESKSEEEIVATYLAYGKSGYVLIAVQALSTACSVALWLTGAAGGKNSLVYGVGVAVLALACPIGYGISVWNDSSKESISKTLMIGYIRACIIVAVVGYGYIFWSYGIADGWKCPYKTPALATWFTNVFFFDTLSLRCSGVVIIFERGGAMCYLLALMNVVFPPFGFLAFAYGQLNKASAREIKVEWVKDTLLGLGNMANSCWTDRLP